jgi:cation diffusion facilitator family transporter
MFVVKFARAPPDEGHPYGHGKIESIGSLGISLGLVGAGASIAYHSYNELLHVAAGTGDVAGPTWVAMTVCVASLVMKEALFRATMIVAKKERSSALMGNAWHHRVDSLTSMIALVGIGGSMMGFPMLDPLGGLLVSALIAKVCMCAGMIEM